MGAALHIRMEHDDVAWTLICGGELDVGSAPHLEEAFGLCEGLKPRALHLDGRDLTFIDSAGVTALIRCVRGCNEEGIALTVELSEQVREVLRHAHDGLGERLVLGPSASAG